MKHKSLLLISLIMILLATCADSTPPSNINPVVDDPELNINVTPQPEQKSAYLTIVITRIGEQAPKIG